MSPPDQMLSGARLLRQIDVLAGTARSHPGSAGVTRLAWSPEYWEALTLLSRWVSHPDIRVEIDAVGSLIADLPGSEPGLAPLVIGSHPDTVVDGGPLDGAYGVVAAFAIVSHLACRGQRLRHPLRAVAWANEEGVVAPPFTGSTAAAGQPVDLDAAGPDGQTLRERLAGCGCDPGAIGGAAWASVAAYLELHVEQGPVLDRAAVPVGVVSGITGSRRGWVRFEGRANHAGTTPMGMRSDALLAAARTVLAIDRLATEGPAATATAGVIEAAPGNMNVIAGRAKVSYDIRSAEPADLEASLTLLHAQVGSIAASTATEASVSLVDSTEPVRTDPLLRRAVADAASALGLASMELVSGAGHDALKVAGIGPVGMIFVPSLGGISHSPEEATRPEDLVSGAQVLLAALRLLDEQLPEEKE